jgi:hypothetical protein
MLSLQREAVGMGLPPSLNEEDLVAGDAERSL